MDKKAFPGSTFVVNDTPPATQCTEDDIILFASITTAGQPFLTQVARFAGIDLAGKNLFLAVPPANAGNYTVISNTDDVLTVTPNFPATDAGNGGFVSDPSEALLTRSVQSFTRFIQANGAAHTSKAGQLFTNLPDPPMDDACTLVFDPD